MKEVYVEWTNTFTSNLHYKWNISWGMEKRIDNRLYDKYCDIHIDAEQVIDSFLTEDLV